MKRNKKQTIKRILSFVIACTIATTMAADIPSDMAKVQASEVTLKNPEVGYSGRSTIEFGHYIQEDTNSDNVINEKDAAQPIKWQILGQDGNKLFLLADKALDCQKYNLTEGDVTWEASSIRTWLNKTFYDTAFNSDEKAGIVSSKIVNKNGSTASALGGNDTEDYVFLLSSDEASNSLYGFNASDVLRDAARICEVTSYAKEKGAKETKGIANYYWLRSPGSDNSRAATIDSDGKVFNYINTNAEGMAVRPALRIDISKLTEGADYSFKADKILTVTGAKYDLVELGRYNGKCLQWRVLSVEGDDVFLFADRIVEKKEFNDEKVFITWENSTLRKWLNNDFYDRAFNVEEKKAIKKTKYANIDGQSGADTEDNISLLSISDVVNTSYGFPEYYSSVSTLVATTLDTDGKAVYASAWWLRSSGNYNSNPSRPGYAIAVNNTGYAYENGQFVTDDSEGVRPAIHISLSALASSNLVGYVDTSENGIYYYDTEGNQLSGYVPDAPHEHEFGEWKVVIAPTETSVGKEERKCECGYSESRDIEKLEHVQDENDETENKENDTHTFGTWKVTKTATVFTTGTKERVCSVCKKTETETIAKLQPTIKLSKKKVTLKKGKKLVIKVSKLAKGDAVKSWKSSNKKVATVSKKGKITAKKKGKAIITVKLKSGKKATVKVTVKK